MSTGRGDHSETPFPQAFSDDPVDVGVEPRPPRVLPVRRTCEQRPKRHLVAGRAEIPPGIDDVRILAHTELVALDEGDRAGVGPGTYPVFSQHGHQPGAVQRNGFPADTGAAAASLSVGDTGFPGAAIGKAGKVMAQPVGLCQLAQGRDSFAWAAVQAVQVFRAGEIDVAGEYQGGTKIAVAVSDQLPGA